MIIKSFLKLNDNGPIPICWEKGKTPYFNFDGEKYELLEFIPVKGYNFPYPDYIYGFEAGEFDNPLYIEIIEEPFSVNVYEEIVEEVDR